MLSSSDPIGSDRIWSPESRSVLQLELVAFVTVAVVNILYTYKRGTAELCLHFEFRAFPIDIFTTHWGGQQWWFYCSIRYLSCRSGSHLEPVKYSSELRNSAQTNLCWVSSDHPLFVAWVQTGFLMGTCAQRRSSDGCKALNFFYSRKQCCCLLRLFHHMPWR